jgi:cystathionine gamma-synthase/methionine-gamma-lyase
MSKQEKRSFATRAVHAGERASAGGHSPVVTPIHTSVSYTYKDAVDLDAVLGAEQEGYVYHRYGNPTTAAFEKVIAELEEGEVAHAFSSGMAAIHAALLAVGVQAGTAVLAASDIYGATITLLEETLAGQGVQIYWADVTDLAAVEAGLSRTAPVAVIAETISNPLLKVADIPTLADLVHRYNAQLLIDNTFASPWLCNPLKHGADISIHSATKYIGGHGDVMAGVVIGSTSTRQRLYELNKLLGGVLGPFEAWLAMRGLKTLSLRMQKQCANAMILAKWLLDHSRIDRVHYPGLSDHPQHHLSGQLFEGKGFGGVLSCTLANADKAAVFRFMNALKLCLPATSLGDIYTLVLHPATASHRGLTAAQRSEIGIEDGLVRISAGIEDPEDLIADLDQALRA